MKFMTLLAVALLFGTATAHAENIYTGGKTGAYHSNFCPPLSKALGEAYFNMRCTTSAGTVENVNKVLADPKAVGFGQFDVVALMAANNPDVEKKMAVVRDDIAHECLFMITNNQRLISIDDVSRFASRIPFVLPPKDSGSSATFDLLRTHDANGLGRAHDIAYATSVDEMISRVLSSPNAVGLFVQLPDPSNARFETIAEKKGRFVPAINRHMLTIQVGGHAVYQPVETAIRGISSIHPEGGKLTTACTPVVVFTGKPDVFAENSNDRKDQTDLIHFIQGVDRAQLLPDTRHGWSWLREKFATVSEKGLDALSNAAAAARQKMQDVSQ